jgi:hypothetical protein
MQRPRRQASKSLSLPPPPHSGEEDLSDLSHSSEDYEKTVQAKLKARLLKGQSDQAETEDGDEEAGQDFRRNKGKTSRKRRSKGKGRQLAKDLSPIAEESPQVADGTSAVVDSTPSTPVLRRGQISKEKMAEIRAFGLQVTHHAKVLAEKNGRTMADILTLAGLQMRPGRSTNPANEFRAWYAIKHPIEKGSKSSSLLSGVLTLT